MELKNVMAGIDVGNGYVKGAVKVNKKSKQSDIDFPSTLCFITNPVDVKVEFDDIKVNNIVDDIFNNMEVTFDSPIVSNKEHCFFGKKAIRLGENVDEFDISRRLSKAENELNYMLILGSLAGKAIQLIGCDKLEEASHDIVNIYVNLALALPIAQFKSHREKIQNKFLNSKHIITIHNFARPIIVNVEIKKLEILSEGESAQLTIQEKGESLINIMLKDIRSKGITLDGITAQDVLSATNIVGIDIGEGTVNFPVIIDKIFDLQLSRTLNSGYGSVLNSALDVLEEENIPFKSRQALGNFLNTPPVALTREKYKKVEEIVDLQVRGFSNLISKELTKLLKKSGDEIQVIYVYGGGATPIKKYLYDILLQITQTGISIPILYLDSSYSRYLNRQGLLITAEKITE